MIYLVMMKIPPIDLLAAPQTPDHSQHEPNALSCEKHVQSECPGQSCLLQLQNCCIPPKLFQTMHSPQPGTSKQQCYDNVDHYL